MSLVLWDLLSSGGTVPLQRRGRRGGEIALQEGDSRVVAAACEAVQLLCTPVLLRPERMSTCGSHGAVLTRTAGCTVQKEVEGRGLGRRGGAQGEML